MKKIKKSKVFYDPIFFAEVQVVVGEVETKTRSGELEIRERDLKDGSVETRYILYLLDKKDFYTLMHECLHLVKHVFVSRMVPFNETNDELIAYYHSYWFKRLWRWVNKI